MQWLSVRMKKQTNMDLEKVKQWRINRDILLFFYLFLDIDPYFSSLVRQRWDFRDVSFFLFSCPQYNSAWLGGLASAEKKM